MQFFLCSTGGASRDRIAQSNQGFKAGLDDQGIISQSE